MIAKKSKIVVFIILCCISILSKTSIDITPVIFIQQGNPEHLIEVLEQAKSHNNHVILIGDDTNKHHSQCGINHFFCADYNKNSERFRNIYKHLASSTFEEELMRFNRWFILEEFMRSSNIKRAFYAEADVMIYCDVSAEDKLHYVQYDAALPMEHGFCEGGTAFWSYSALNSFCSFLNAFYQDQKMVETIEDQFNFGGEEYHDDWPHMAHWMHENNKIFKIADLNNLIDNTIFNTSMRDDYILAPNAALILEYKRLDMKQIKLRAYKRNDDIWIKDILWNKGLPYCNSNDLAIFIQFKTLHFKNGSQKLIKNYRSIKVSTSQYLDPYASINPLPFYMLGFFSIETQKYLKHFVQTYKPKIIVDLGSWLGSSTSFMAFFMPDDGRVYAVDYFNSSLDSYSINKKDMDAYNVEAPELYQQFLSNMMHYKLCDKVIPVKMSTLEAASSLDIKSDLIYVDASTEEESIYNDIIHWYPKLNKNGLMCGGNWKWFVSVQNGVTRAAKELGKNIKTDNDFWYFE